VKAEHDQSTGGVKISNSDGWDTYRSDNIVIQNSFVDNTDGMERRPFTSPTIP